MQLLRDILRRSLATSLSTLSPEDRLATAWPVVAGHALSAKALVSEYRDGTLTLSVEDSTWREQVRMAAQTLQGELARVSGIPLAAILVVLTPRPTQAIARPTTR